MSVAHPKTFEMIRATGSRLKAGDVLEVGGRKVRLNKQGVAAVDDAGFASALVEKYGRHSTNAEGGQLLSAELEAYNEHRDRKVRRTYVFSVPEMPWKKGR